MAAARRSPSRDGGLTSDAAAAAEAEESERVLVCCRCRVALSEEGADGQGSHALASGGCLLTVCRLCYLLGLASSLVAEASLTSGERRVLEEEISGVVEALRSHILRYAA